MADASASAADAPDSEDVDVREIRNQAEAATALAQDAIERVNELEAELEQRRERDRRLVEEIADLRERTQLLQALQRATAPKKDERLAVLLQTLHNDAKSNGQRDAATMDVNGWQHAVGGKPDRALWYGEDGDAKRAVELVGDEDVLQYVEEARGARKNSRLILDLEAGDLATSIAGQRIGEGGESQT